MIIILNTSVVAAAFIIFIVIAITFTFMISMMILLMLFTMTIMMVMMLMMLMMRMTVVAIAIISFLRRCFHVFCLCLLRRGRVHIWAAITATRLQRILRACFFQAFRACLVEVCLRLVHCRSPTNISQSNLLGVSLRTHLILD